MFKLVFQSGKVETEISNDRLSYFEPIIDSLEREQKDYTFYDGSGKIILSSVTKKEVKDKEKRIKTYRKNMGDIPKHP